MSQVTVSIVCSCKHTNKRKYSWFDPSHFKKDPTLTSIFYCEKCLIGHSYKMKYTADKRIEIVEKLAINTLIKESNDLYIGGYIDEETEGETKVEVLSEDAALTLLQDID